MRPHASILIAIALFGGAACAAPASAGTTLSAILAAPDWLNGRPNAAELRGKVVLVDFYTFGCFNCKNVEPNLRALYKDVSRKDLVILGVHSPETSFERDRGHLIASFRDQGVAWPVAVDNDFRIWNAYGVSAWPTQMLFDRTGTLRKTIVGDSQDAEVNAAIKALIGEGDRKS